MLYKAFTRERRCRVCQHREKRTAAVPAADKCIMDYRERLHRARAATLSALCPEGRAASGGVTTDHQDKLLVAGTRLLLVLTLAR